MYKKLVILLVLTCLQQSVFSLNLDSLILNYQNDVFYFNGQPFLQAGTHVNALGIGAVTGLQFQQEILQTFIGQRIGVHASAMLNESYFGIPGQSAQANIGGHITFSFAGNSDFTQSPWRIREQGRHNVGFYVSRYFSTDGTSQWYGGFTASFNFKNDSYRFTFDNDDTHWAMLINDFKTDKFRTGKLELEYLHHTDTELYGASISCLLWTGDTSPIVDNTTDYGADYSHGIIGFSYIYNAFKLTIGYDSEAIREFVQNGWHSLKGLGSVPLVDRADRLFLQIQIFPDYYNY